MLIRPVTGDPFFSGLGPGYSISNSLATLNIVMGRRNIQLPGQICLENCCRLRIDLAEGQVAGTGYNGWMKLDARRVDAWDSTIFYVRHADTISIFAVDFSSQLGSSVLRLCFQSKFVGTT